MKKVLLTLTILSLISFQGLTAFGQDNNGSTTTENANPNTDEANDGGVEGDSTETLEPDSAAADSIAQAKAEEEAAAAKKAEEAKKIAEQPEVKQSGHAIVKKYFIDGGWEFMSIVLVCLILGLGFAIERLVVLSLNTINVKKFISQIEAELKAGNVENAKAIARNTRGPIASIYYQGLDRASEGTDIVEKSIVSYGSVQMGLLEKGMVWISLFISLAPMLGFMGTVIGMIIAFDQIEAMGDISPSAVAGGIKVALLTTVAGLIVAIILQIFYNLIVSIIDGMVNKMEDSSIVLVDMMIKYGIVKK